jgi:hypothetical protein
MMDFLASCNNIIMIRILLHPLNCSCCVYLQAIEFLSRMEQLSVHAVHFAIALHDLELLHLTSDLQSKICKLTYTCTTF